MAEQRVQINSLQGLRNVSSPSARAIDPYYEVDPNKTSLGQLVNSLKAINPTIQGIVDADIERQRDADAQAAEIQFAKDSLTNDPIKLSTGEMHPDQSWAWTVGYKNAAGKQIFQKWQIEKNREYQEKLNSGEFDNNPDMFIGWLNQSKAELFEQVGSDKYVIGGFTDQMRGYEAQLISAHSASSYNRAYDNREALAISNVDDAITSFLEGATTFDKAFASIKEEVETAYQTGFRGEKGTGLNDKVVQAIIDKSVAEMNPALLRFAEYKELSPKHERDILAAKETIERLQEDIISDNARLTAEVNDQTQARIQLDLIEEIYVNGKGLDALTVGMRKEYINAGGKVSELESMISAYRSAENNKTPAQTVKAGYYQNKINDGISQTGTQDPNWIKITRDELLKSVAEGELHPNDIGGLFKLLNDSEKLQGFINDTDVEKELKNAQTVLYGEESFFTLADPTEQAKRNDTRNQFIAEFNTKIQELEASQDTPVTRQQAADIARQIGQGLIESIPEAERIKNETIQRKRVEKAERFRVSKPEYYLNIDTINPEDPETYGEYAVEHKIPAFNKLSTDMQTFLIAALENPEELVRIQGVTKERWKWVEDDIAHSWYYWENAYDANVIPGYDRNQ